MPSDHLTTSHISGPCTIPPRHPAGEPAHVVGMKLYCASHCVACSPVIEFRGGGLVVGTQDGLF